MAGGAAVPRLHLIANNSRFVIDAWPGANLASRVLGLSLRRLSQDIQAVHGYPVFLAETFVDVSRFVGTCYRASNWRSLDPRLCPRARRLGALAPPRPAQGDLRVRTDDAAAEALSRRCHGGRPSQCGAGLAVVPLEVPECLTGARLPADTVRSPSARGYRGVTSFWSPSKQRYTVLAALPPETLDNAIGQWTEHSTAHAPVAMDGKDLRGASKHRRRAPDDGRGGGTRGMVMGQRNPGRTRALQQLDLAGRIVTVDAITLSGAAPTTSFKDNQETVEDLTIDFSDAPSKPSKGHGRIERRLCRRRPFPRAPPGDAHRTRARDPQDRQEQHRSDLLTSLGTDRAGPEELLALVRNHWHIENRLHRARLHLRRRPLPGVCASPGIACLTNVAIAIVRCSGRFRYLPEANRHYAARAQDALDAILIAPTA